MLQVQGTQVGVVPKYTGTWQVRGWPARAWRRAAPAFAAARGARLRIAALTSRLCQGLVYMARHEGLRGMFKGNGEAAALAERHAPSPRSPSPTQAPTASELFRTAP